MGHDQPDEPHDHDRGLAFDLSTLIERRRAIKLFASAGLIAVTGCGAQDLNPTTSTTSQSVGATTKPSTAPTRSNPAAVGGSSSTVAGATNPTDKIPTETGGPFPGDGTNGPNALAQSGIVRSDIRSSFGSSTTTASGVPLAVKLKILGGATNGIPLVGTAVYLWHCDIAGRYSLYSAGATNENYLRGVQATDQAGLVTFQSIFPAAYPGRWPHIHFEVFPTLADATGGGKNLVTSQLALDEGTCRAVYATDGYGQSARTFAQTPLAKDMVFSDGYKLEMPSMTGDPSTGFTAELSLSV